MKALLLHFGGWLSDVWKTLFVFLMYTVFLGVTALAIYWTMIDTRPPYEPKWVKVKNTDGAESGYMNLGELCGLL